MAGEKEVKPPARSTSRGPYPVSVIRRRLRRRLDEGHPEAQEDWVLPCLQSNCRHKIREDKMKRLLLPLKRLDPRPLRFLTAPIRQVFQRRISLNPL